MLRHSWDVTPKEAFRVQEELAKYLKLYFSGGAIKTVGGVDCSYKDGVASATVVIMRFPDFEIIENISVKKPISFPYVPTLLTFREGPPVMECFGKMRTKPDCMLYDGQGTAHPRRMGLAAHLGVLTGIPSVGCAKSLLVGENKEPGTGRGSYRDIRDKSGHVVCTALRTRANVKPVYVSPGHLMDMKTAVKLVLDCSLRYRLPEPLRLAHKLAAL